jgi:hypothetical protein
MFSVSSTVDTKTLEEIFRHKVLKMLQKKGKITQDMIALLDKWRHSGFNVYCGPRIQPGDEESMENLARYIVRASFSQERMTYFPEDSKVVYRSKDGKEEKIIDAIEWPRRRRRDAPKTGCKHKHWRPCVLMCLIRENPAESGIRYYGYYSNVVRGKRKMRDEDELIRC